MTIYIHGIGRHAPSDQLKTDWDIALFGKLRGDETTMAYWSDITHGGTEDVTRSRAAGMRSERVTREDAVDIDEILSNARVPAVRRNEAVRLIEGLAAELTRAEPIQGSNSRRGGPRATLLPLYGSFRRPVARAFVRLLLRDVAAYFYQPSLRKQIQDRLRATIAAQRHPFALIAHSLGSVIAFEVLADKGFRRKKCDLFVTIGSPLGIREVQDVIEDFGSELQIPRDVRAWHNFADRLDPVAIDAGLANDFGPAPALHNSPGSAAPRIVDRQIVNERTATLRKFNPHSAIGYLSHPDVRKVVHHQLAFDSFGRFLVARDVAEEFVDNEHRIPVLIEALEPDYPAVDEGPDDCRKREQKMRGRVKRDNATASEAQDTLYQRVVELKQRVIEIATELSLDDSSSTQDRKRFLTEEVAPIALRKYVAACLTASEVSAVAAAYRELNVYAIWRNAAKRKQLERSHRPLKVDAARNSYGAAGDRVTWAVLDTGVNWEHPHFAKHRNIEAVWDCTQPTDTPVPMYSAGTRMRGTGASADPDGHGTHVCGIVAGELVDGEQRILGLAPRTKLIVYKVLGDDGSGDDGSIIKAIDHIFKQNQTNVSGLKIHGVNLSLGGPFDTSVYGCGFSPTCKELRDLWRQGTLVCVAAGNEGQVLIDTDEGGIDLYTQMSIGDPANLEDCIAVGSVHADKPHLYGVSSFSSRGPTADGRFKPDVVAPGERIRSCHANYQARAGRGRRAKPEFDELYCRESGTSMACPHVSGLLAAFLSVRREFIGRPDDVKRILLANCNDLGRDRYHQGAGMPNLMSMLTNT